MSNKGDSSKKDEFSNASDNKLGCEAYISKELSDQMKGTSNDKPKIAEDYDVDDLGM